MLFSVFRNDEGENLLPFDELAELLQMDLAPNGDAGATPASFAPDAALPLDLPHLHHAPPIITAPLVTTAPPTGPIPSDERAAGEDRNAGAGAGVSVSPQLGGWEG
mgnify:CR=1 FL=1